MIGLVVVLFLYLIKDDQIGQSNIELNAVSPLEDITTEKDQSEEQSTIAVIDVKGAIIKPGVYEMNMESRVNDVIQKAGGFSEDADQTQVNLAQKVQDEMIVIIPKEGEVATQEGGEKTASGSGAIRINYATQEEIETLSGVGPSKAQAIIQHREEHGFFHTVEDLLEIPGIGEKTLENFRDNIQVP